jgi:proteasome beta subunit
MKSKEGTTTVGIIAKDCVVLAAEAKATLGYLISSKETRKIYKIDDKMAIAVSGSVGDAQQLIRIIKAEIELYKHENKEVTVNAVATLLANILQSTRYFPLLTMLILGGVDKRGYHLYNIDVTGGMTEDKYTACGSGSPIAFGVLERGFKENMKTEDAVNLAIESIKAAIERDVFSGGKKIDVAVITEKGIELLRHEITPNLS